MSKKKKIGIVLLSFLALVIVAGFIYVNDYYHSEPIVNEYLANSDNVEVHEISDGLLFDGTGTADALVFYPGAKVEYTAYAPIMKQLAENGVDCFLIKMPLNLAILGMNKASDVMNRYDYEHWYLSGHSLGGAMAASYTADHLDSVAGLILLAAYPTKDLYPGKLRVLSIYGSKDLVLNHKKLEEGKAYMPEDFTELRIEGGNHAGFGAYGEQSGDGVATITQEKQWSQTVEAILAFAK